MRSRRAGSAAALALAAAWACQNGIALDLEGKACADAEPRCLPGFLCSAEGRCVRPDSLVSGGGSGGVGGDRGGSGGSGGSTEGGTGGSAEGGRSGASGEGGSAGSAAGAGGSGGAGGDEPDAAAPDASSQQEPDAGPPPEPDAGNPIDAGPPCTKVVVYQDGDGDGYGRTDQQSLACLGPGVALLPGDCRDDLVDVHPDQETYFGVGYAEPTAPDGVSFDYDCSSAEEVDPGNSPAGGDPDCESQTFLNCAGVGYAETARTGAGIDPLCGSATVITCQGDGAACVDNAISTTMPYRCR